MSIGQSNFSQAMKEVEEAVKVLINEFQTMPFNFFYEEDLRARLYSHLFTRIDHKISLPKGSNWTKEYAKPNKDILINPVKAEYGKPPDVKNKYRQGDFDIVVVSESTEKDGDNFFVWPCDIVIEIKYSTDNPFDKVGDHMNDIRKVMDYNNGRPNYLGIALCFDLHKINDQRFSDYYNGEFHFEQVACAQIVFQNNNIYGIYIEPYERDKVYLCSCGRKSYA